MGGTQEVVGSQNTSNATIAVSAILAVLFLLSLVVIIVLVFCVLRLNKQIGGMKGIISLWVLLYTQLCVEVLFDVQRLINDISTCLQVNKLFTHQ